MFIRTQADSYIWTGREGRITDVKNSKGDYAYYVGCERRLDDYKGLAALLYASIE